MAIITRWIVPLTVWAAAIYGGLQLQSLDLGHSICGPWGCGPPTEAVLAMHVFWLLLMLPIGLVAWRPSAATNWHRIGLGILTIAAVVILGIGIYDYFTWQKDPGAPVYVVQRFLFRLATLSDFPVVQLGILGAVLALLGRRADRRATTPAAPTRSVTQ